MVEVTVIEDGRKRVMMFRCPDCQGSRVIQRRYATGRLFVGPCYRCRPRGTFGADVQKMRAQAG